MAIKDWARGRGEASHLSDLKVTASYQSPDYQLVVEDLTRGETRLLKVFSLLPRNQHAPTFHARVDDGGPDKPKDPELDIDIRNVSSDVASDFKAGRRGYKGHHNDRTVEPNRRVFEVEIATPRGLVFDGVVSFSVTFSRSTSIGITSAVSVLTTVKRADDHEP
jgi:hypothetical protein